jgi:hypothetical protein
VPLNIRGRPLDRASMTMLRAIKIDGIWIFNPNTVSRRIAVGREPLPHDRPDHRLRTTLNLKLLDAYHLGIAVLKPVEGVYR